VNPAVIEALACTTAILAALQASVGSTPSLATSQLGYLSGGLAASAPDDFAVANEQVLSSPYWPALVACFEQARVAGATYESMDAVRIAILALAPVTWLGVAVANFALRCALAEQVQILAATTFTTRPQIDNYLDAINASFDDAENVAADNLDNVVFTSLIQLQAACVNDLSSRAATLPAIVSVTLAQRMPSYTLAQYLYQDPTQADTLAALNDVPHPLFMPLQIQALALG
jgi:prophage DNA circulation protein